jgi:2',3'-cyclic-nucleotide 2'-phosphodiesterase (5'-nucleotidase family)
MKEQPISTFITLQKGDHKIGVVSLIDAGSFDFSMVRNLTIVPEHDIIFEVLHQLQPKVDLLLLLYHNGFEKAVGLAEKFSDIDIVIAGHSQERAEKLFGKQIVVQSGFDGEYLGILEIEFLDAKYIFRNSFLPIDNTFIENYYFKDRVRQIFTDLNIEY